MIIRYSDRVARQLRNSPEGGGGEGGTPSSGESGQQGSGEGSGSGTPNGDGSGGSGEAGGSEGSASGGSGSGDQGGKPNGDSSGGGSGDDTDWKARSRQNEDARKREKARADEAEAKAKSSDDVLERLRKTLDPNGEQGDEKPEDAAQRLTSERDQKDAELRAERLERRAEKEARAQGLDPDALLDSRGFVTALGKLDPSADDFGDQLKAAVEKAGESNPRLKAEEPAAGGSTAPATTPSTGGGEEKTSTEGGSKSAVEAQLEARRKSRQA